MKMVTCQCISNKLVFFLNKRRKNLIFWLVKISLDILLFYWKRILKFLQPFAEIVKLTDIQEGVIVRCIQQLNETLQDVKDASRIIGNQSLQQKMDCSWCFFVCQFFYIFNIFLIFPIFFVFVKKIVICSDFLYSLLF